MGNQCIPQTLERMGTGTMRHKPPWLCEIAATFSFTLEPSFVSQKLCGSPLFIIRPFYFATFAAASTSETARMMMASPEPFRMLP